MDAQTRKTIPVLIVGGGPVGLALACDLGWRGVECLLVERGDGTIEQPKTNEVNIRTMEFCRRWGIVDTIEAARLSARPSARSGLLHEPDGLRVVAASDPALGEQRHPDQPSEKGALPADCLRSRSSPSMRELCPSVTHALSLPVRVLHSDA